MAEHGVTENRSPFNSVGQAPGQPPSFDNFGELVNALKMQFLQGVPPTPDNVNRATDRAIQTIMGEGAQQNTPGGVGADVAGLPK